MFLLRLPASIRSRYAVALLSPKRRHETSESKKNAFLIWRCGIDQTPSAQ